MCFLLCRYPDEVIAGGVESTEFVPGRYELINEGQDFAVVVDYAHTPDALANVLDDMRAMGAKRVITVFGCGGDRDTGKRPLMAAVKEALGSPCSFVSASSTSFSTSGRI